MTPPPPPPEAMGWMQAPAQPGSIGHATQTQGPEAYAPWPQAEHATWALTSYPPTYAPSSYDAGGVFIAPAPEQNALALSSGWSSASYPAPHGFALHQPAPWAAGGVSVGGPGASTEAAHLLAAAQLIARSPAPPTMVGAGVAFGLGLRPTVEGSFRVLHAYEGRDPRFLKHRWVEYRRKLGADATLAVGGGLGTVGGAVFVSAGRERELVYQTLVPPERARELFAAQYDDALHAALGLQFQSPVPLPDLRRPRDLPNASNVYFEKSMTLSGGLIVGGTGYKATAYTSLTGQFLVRLARLDDHALLGVRPTKIRELGLQLSAGFLNTINASTKTAHATEWLVSVDLTRPEGLAAIEAAIHAGAHGKSPLPERPTSEEGTLVARYQRAMPEWVKLIQLETTDLEEVSHGAQVLSSKAGASSTHTKRKSVLESLLGVTVRETTAHTRKVAVPLKGFESRTISLMAEYQHLGAPATTPPIFMGLLLSMKLENAGGRLGDNRENLLEKLRAVYGMQIPSFPPEASRKGYSAVIERALDASDFFMLAGLSREQIESRAGTSASETEALVQLFTKMQGAAAEPLPPPPTSDSPANIWAAVVAQGAPPQAVMPSPHQEALAQAQVLQKELRSRKMVTALCRLLDVDTLRLRVRGEAYEAPLLAVDELQLRFEGTDIHHADTVEAVAERLKAVGEARKAVDDAFEALAQDPIVNHLLPHELPERVASLDRAMRAMVELGKIDHLRPLQQLCFVGRPEIFEVLPPEDKAESLRLLVQHRRAAPGCRDKDALAAKIESVAHEVEEERLRLPRLRMPPTLFAARNGALDDAQVALEQVRTAALDAAFGQLALGTPPPPTMVPWTPPPAFGAHPRLLGLQNYEAHIVIQDDAAIADHLPEVREALEALVEEVSKYDQNGIEVSFLSDVLRGQPPHCLTHSSQVAWLMEGLRDPVGAEAKLGNAIDVLTRNHVDSDRRHGGALKGLAPILITTGKMSDKDVFVEAMERTQDELGDRSGKVCVGIVRVGLDKLGRDIAASLDASPSCGAMIETSHSEDPRDPNLARPLRERLLPLLEGMIDPKVDRQNDVNAFRRGMRKAARTLGLR